MITPDSVSAAIAQTNFIRSNGYLSDYRYLYLTTTDATVHSTDDIRNIVIRNDGKRIVRIGDIATVEYQRSGGIYENQCKWERRYFDSHYQTAQCQSG